MTFWSPTCNQYAINVDILSIRISIRIINIGLKRQVKRSSSKGKNGISINLYQILCLMLFPAFTNVSSFRFKPTRNSHLVRHHGRSPHAILKHLITSKKISLKSVIQKQIRCFLRFPRHSPSPCYVPAI